MIAEGSMGEVPFYLDVRWASFDPGLITGVTLWGPDGEVIHTNEVDIPNLHKLLDFIENVAKPYLLIVEEFRLYQHKALQQSGSKLDTVQVIGMLKRVAYKLDIETIEIRADCKPIAAMWSQTKIPKGHMSNWMASYLVGYYHLHQKGIIRAKVLDS